MSEPYLFTVPTGEPVIAEIFHTGIFGQTQFSGKSTLIKRMAYDAVSQGYKVIVFDTKETEPDYLGFGQDIPVCMREAKDTLVLLGLLESIFRRKLTQYYATLDRVNGESENYDEMIQRLKKAEEKERQGWVKDADRTLYNLLSRLQEETKKIQTVGRLELRDGINRMVINTLSVEAQQLVVRNAFEDALRIYKRNVVLIIDEAFKFIPQGYSSAATRSIMNVMTQGAKTGLFTWIATQFLAITDKDPLKACALKFLGTQDHPTEVKHTLDLVPEARRYKADDVMKLKLGHWILVRKRPSDVRIVYAAPYGVPPDAGVSVAKGKMTPEQVRDKYLQRKCESEIEDMKEIEELKKKYNEAEGLRRAAVEHFDHLQQAHEELKSQVDKLASVNESLTKENNELRPAAKFLETFKTMFESMMPKTTVRQNQHTILSIEPESMTLQVHKPRDKVVTVGTESIHDRILYIIGIEKKGKPTTLTEIVDAAKEHAWVMTNNSIAPQAGKIAKTEGLLIEVSKNNEVAYRLPEKLTVQELIK